MIEHMFALPTLDREQLGLEIERRMAEVQGIINAQQAELVRLAALADQVGAWSGPGLRSLSHWLMWQIGAGPTTAHSLARLVERGDELPATAAAFAAGELSLDQASTVAAFAPGWADVEACALAREMTPTQLHRVLSTYDWGTTKPKPEKRFGLSTGFDDDGDFWIRGRARGEEGARLQAALVAAKDTVTTEWKDERSATGLADDSEPPTWLDALLRIADRSLGAEVVERPAHPRATVLVHVDVDQQTARVHMGPVLDEMERRLLTCDATFRLLYQQCGKAIGIGRKSQAIPRWLRRHVEHRDGGCRVPGCGARHVQVHHVWHWEDGGPTDPGNLICLCPHHHRLHHRGLLTITGTDAEAAHGIAFHDRWGRALPGVAPPTPPTGPPTPSPSGPYRHPAGERLTDNRWIWFNRPSAA